MEKCLGILNLPDPVVIPDQEVPLNCHLRVFFHVKVAEKDMGLAIFNHLGENSKILKRPRDAFRFSQYEILDQVLRFLSFICGFSLFIT